MNAITATVKAGRIEAQVPPEWPDGTEVEIQLVNAREQSGDEGAMTPEKSCGPCGMENMEPLDISAQDASDLDSWERKVNDYTIATMDKGIEDVFR